MSTRCELLDKALITLDKQLISRWDFHQNSLRKALIQHNKVGYEHRFSFVFIVCMHNHTHREHNTSSLLRIKTWNITNRGLHTTNRKTKCMSFGMAGYMDMYYLTKHKNMKRLDSMESVINILLCYNHVHTSRGAKLLPKDTCHINITINWTCML